MRLGQDRGALLNQKLTPDIFDSEENIKKLAQLIRTFFRLGGHHVQFNVVSAELLRRPRGSLRTSRI